MSRDLEKELNELKKNFPPLKIEHWSEGGVIFFRLTNFSFVKDINECVLQIGSFLGYESRLFFPEKINTKADRNWNHRDVLIGNKTYHAFSYRVPEGSILNIFLGHLGGAL